MGVVPVYARAIQEPGRGKGLRGEELDAKRKAVKANQFDPNLSRETEALRKKRAGWLARVESGAKMSKPPRQKPQKRSEPSETRVVVDRRKSVVIAAPAVLVAALSLEEAILTNMPVPTPAERVRPEGMVYDCRDGQSVFRETILSVYRCCAVTGCAVPAALEAAHIVPYVDRRSNIIMNGLCLRADVHRLYDRNLIRIGADYRIEVSDQISGYYGDLHGRSIALPRAVEDWPNKELLAVRHRFIEGAE